MQTFPLSALLFAFLSHFTVILPLSNVLMCGRKTQILEFVFLVLFIILFECLWAK